MPIGRIRWYDRKRGYGFIERPDGRDLYFHATGLGTTAHAALIERGAVTFDLAPGRRGEKAVCIEAADV